MAEGWLRGKAAGGGGGARNSSGGAVKRAPTWGGRDGWRIKDKMAGEAALGVTTPVLRNPTPQTRPWNVSIRHQLEPQENLPPVADLSLWEKPEHRPLGEWAQGCDGDLFKTFKVLFVAVQAGLPPHLVSPSSKLRHQTQWIHTSSPSYPRAFALFPCPEHGHPLLTLPTPVLTSLP